MSADGAWTITIDSPMGKQEASLDLKVQDDALTGTQSAQGQSSEIKNGKADGDKLSWSADITSPFPMTLEFAGAVAGDSLTGNVKAGSFGSFSFTGQRA